MIEIVLDPQIVGFVQFIAPTIIVVFTLAIPISALTNTNYFVSVLVGLFVAAILSGVTFFIVSLFTQTPLGIQIFNITVGV